MGGTLPPSLSSHRHHLRFGPSFHTSVSCRGAKPLPEAAECRVSIHSKIFEGRVAQRHQLIWKGILRHDDQSTEVRVRNISRSGAMIESRSSVPMAIEVLLELGESVSISATVEWALGN